MTKHIKVNIVAWREVPQNDIDNFMTRAVENYIDIYNKYDNDETYKRFAHPINLPLVFEISDDLSKKIKDKLSGVTGRTKFYSVAIMYYLGKCEMVKSVMRMAQEVKA